jgi:hypothetical protein
MTLKIVSEIVAVGEAKLDIGERRIIRGSLCGLRVRLKCSQSCLEWHSTSPDGPENGC